MEGGWWLTGAQMHGHWKWPRGNFSPPPKGIPSLEEKMIKITFQKKPTRQSKKENPRLTGIPHHLLILPAASPAARGTLQASSPPPRIITSSSQNSPRSLAIATGTHTPTGPPETPPSPSPEGSTCPIEALGQWLRGQHDVGRPRRALLRCVLGAEPAQQALGLPLRARGRCAVRLEGEGGCSGCLRQKRRE